MESTTSAEEKNKTLVSFKRWSFLRTWEIRTFWVLFGLYCLTFIVYPLVNPLINVHIPVPRNLPLVNVPRAYGPLYLAMIIVAGVIYFVVIAFTRFFIIPKRLGGFSQYASIYTATVAAEELKKGNTVLASLSLDNLLLTLSDFLKQKLVCLGPYSVAPVDFMHIKPESISKLEVFKTIEINKDTSDIQKELEVLATRLHGDPCEGYLAANRFLIWLDNKVEPHHTGHPSIRDKHQYLKTLLPQVVSVASVVLPFISAMLFSKINS